MKTIQLTRREADELAHAINIAKETIKKIEALKVFNIDPSELWEIKNYSAQISAVLYNVTNGVYRQGTRP